MNFLNLVQTADRHMAPLESSARSRMFDVPTQAKPNGNTVDMDRELIEVTKNGLQ